MNAMKCAYNKSSNFMINLNDCLLFATALHSLNTFALYICTVFQTVRSGFALVVKKKEHGKENYILFYIVHTINYVDCKINDSYFNKSATLTAVLSILIAYFNNNDGATCLVCTNKFGFVE